MTKALAFPIAAAAPAPVARTGTLVGRNTAFRLAAQLVSALINLAGMVLLGNYLSASGYGDYVFYYALIPLVASASDLGVGVIITREIARSPAIGARLIGDGLLIKGVIAALILAVTSVVSTRLMDPAHAVLVILVVASALADFSTDASVWAFRAHERLDLEALLLIVSQVAWLAGIAIGLATGASLPFLLASAAVAFALRSAVGMIVLSRTMYLPAFAPQWRRALALVAEGWPMGLAMLGVVLYGRTGVLMLKGLSTSSDVACFNVAYMLSQPLGFISSSLSLAAFPAIARYVQENTGAVRQAFQRACKYQMLVTLPLSTGLVLLADRVTGLMFHGAGFERAGLGLKIIAIGLPFIFLNLQSRYVLTAMNRQRVYLWAVMAGLAVNAGLCAVVIRPFGSVGAAWALVAAEFAIFVVCQSVLRSYVGVQGLLRAAGRPALAAAAMGSVVYACRGLSLPLVIVAGAATYVGGLVVIRALSPDELELMRNVYVSFRLPGSERLMRRAGRS